VILLCRPDSAQLLNILLLLAVVVMAVGGSGIVIVRYQLT
jgi:flagellar basal body-associated protein FliL